MAAYVVMDRTDAGPGEPAPTVFVRDGFHWPAFFVPILWLLWHRLWIEAALALGATLLLSAAGELFDLGVYATLLGLLVSVYFGLEGAALRIRALTRRGWRERAVVEAPRLSDAELLYFGSSGVATEEEADELQAAPVFAGAARLQAQSSARAIGLVPYPERP